MGTQVKKKQEAQEAVTSKTCGTPAFAVLKPVRQSSETEAAITGQFWPAGIKYGSVKLPQVPPLEDSSDRLEILELLDD